MGYNSLFHNKVVPLEGSPIAPLHVLKTVLLPAVPIATYVSLLIVTYSGNGGKGHSNSLPGNRSKRTAVKLQSQLAWSWRMDVKH